VEGVLPGTDGDGRDIAVKCWIKIFHDEYLKKLIWVRENTGANGQRLSVEDAYSTYNGMTDK